VTDGLRTRHSAGFEQLAHLLGRCRMEKITGSMHVIGTPGGVFHLRHGALVGVASPGAPGADVLLLRSGRISESDWTAALRTGAETHTHQAELVAQGSIKSTELHVISTMAAQDGAFAAFAGKLERYVVTEQPLNVLLPITDGIDIAWLLQETSRRLDALASLRFPVSPFRDRVAPAPGADPSGAVPAALRREILTVADGRRSARDIAFLIGCSVYSVTVAISRMLGEGLVEIVTAMPLTTPSAPRSVAPLAVREPVQPAAGHPLPSGLPQRRPGTSGINRPATSGVGDEQVELKPLGWRLIPRWRRRIRAGPTEQSETRTESLDDPEGNSLEP
jgi:hypothetical protein